MRELVDEGGKASPPATPTTEPPPRRKQTLHEKVLLAALSLSLLDRRFTRLTEIHACLAVRGSAMAVLRLLPGTFERDVEASRDICVGGIMVRDLPLPCLPLNHPPPPLGAVANHLGPSHILIDAHRD